MVEGSIFNNVTDQKLWIYADDPTNPGTLVWQPNPSAEANHVTLLTTSGQTPTPVPPIAAGTATPAVGDLAYNTVDEDLWVWALTPGTQNYNWQPLRSTSGLVFISDTAGDVPANPAAGQTVFDFTAYIAAHHPGHVLQEGDRFINRADGESWVYVQDPNNAGQFMWVMVPADNHAWVSHTTSEDPAAYTFQPAPRIGDVFYNDADNKLWVRAMDPTTSQEDWHQVSLSATFSTNASGDDPTSLSSAAVIRPGDHFVNTADGLTWLAVDDPANTGTTIWQEVGTRPDVTVSILPGDTPTSLHTYGPPIPETGTWTCRNDRTHHGQTAAPGSSPRRSLRRTACTRLTSGTDHTAVCKNLGQHDVVTSLPLARRTGTTQGMLNSSPELSTSGARRGVVRHDGRRCHHEPRQEEPVTIVGQRDDVFVNKADDSDVGLRRRRRLWLTRLGTDVLATAEGHRVEKSGRDAAAGRRCRRAGARRRVPQHVRRYRLDLRR